MIQDKTDYVGEIERQLKNEVTYNPLNKDPTTEYTEEIKDFLSCALENKYKYI